MYRFFTGLSFFLLSACSGLWSYTVENKTNGVVTVVNELKEIEIGAGDCIQLFDFFSIGDFPVKFFRGNQSLEDGKTYLAGNYRVELDGSITKISDEEACTAKSGFARSKPKDPLVEHRNPHEENIPKPKEDEHRNPHEANIPKPKEDVTILDHYNLGIFSENALNTNVPPSPF